MAARVLRLVLTVAIVSAGVVHAMRASEPPAVPAERSILVTALDSTGAPIRDLSAADFAVREDGEPRVVTDAQPAAEPLSIAVLIDTAQPPMGAASPVRDLRVGLEAFVTTIHGASPESRIALFELAGAAVRTVNFTTKTADLTRSIRRLFPSQRTGAVLLEGIVDAAKDLGEAPTPRRAIVTLTFASPEASQVQPRTVAQAAEKSGAAVWAISIQGTQDAATATSGTQGADPLGPVREVILENLPPATGGERLTALTATALEPLLKRVAHALLSQYVVTYTRPDGAAAPRAVQPAARGAAKVLMSPMIR